MQDFLIEIATRELMAGKEMKFWLEMDNGRAWRTARKVQGFKDYRSLNAFCRAKSPRLHAGPCGTGSEVCWWYQSASRNF